MQTFTGRCHCGDIVFEIDTTLDGVAICQLLDMQLDAMLSCTG